MMDKLCIATLVITLSVCMSSGPEVSWNWIALLHYQRVNIKKTLQSWGTEIDCRDTLSSPCAGYGKLYIGFLTYGGHNSRTMDGSCCDAPEVNDICSDPCDFIFQISVLGLDGHNLTNRRPSGNPISQHGNITFPLPVLSSETLNPMSFAFNRWQPVVKVIVEVFDLDVWSERMTMKGLALVDKLENTLMLTQPSDMFTCINVYGERRTTWLQLAVRYSCDPTYSGTECSVDCLRFPYLSDCPAPPLQSNEYIDVLSQANMLFGSPLARCPAVKKPSLPTTPPPLTTTSTRLPSNLSSSITPSGPVTLDPTFDPTLTSLVSRYTVTPSDRIGVSSDPLTLSGTVKTTTPLPTATSSIVATKSTVMITTVRPSATTASLSPSGTTTTISLPATAKMTTSPPITVLTTAPVVQTSDYLQTTMPLGPSLGTTTTPTETTKLTDHVFLSSLSPEPSYTNFPPSTTDSTGTTKLTDHVFPSSLSPEPSYTNFPPSTTDSTGTTKLTDHVFPSSLTPEPSYTNFPPSTTDSRRLSDMVTATLYPSMTSPEVTFTSQGLDPKTSTLNSVAFTTRMIDPTKTHTLATSTAVTYVVSSLLSTDRTTTISSHHSYSTGVPATSVTSVITPTFTSSITDVTSSQTVTPPGGTQTPSRGPTPTRPPASSKGSTTPSRGPTVPNGGSPTPSTKPPAPSKGYSAPTRRPTTPNRGSRTPTAGSTPPVSPTLPRIDLGAEDDDPMEYWGVIVGSVLGGLAVVAFTGFLIYRSRQKTLQRRQEVYTVTPRSASVIEENGTSGRSDVPMTTALI